MKKELKQNKKQATHTNTQTHRHTDRGKPLFHYKGE